MILRPFKPVQPQYRRGQGEQATSTSVFALGLYIRLPELRSPYQVPPEICLIGSGSSMNAFQQGVANARRISQGIIDSPISTEHSKTFVALVGSWPIRLSDGEMVVARTDAMSSGGSSSFEAFSLGLLEYHNFSRFCFGFMNIWALFQSRYCAQIDGIRYSTMDIKNIQATFLDSFGELISEVMNSSSTLLG